MRFPKATRCVALGGSGGSRQSQGTGHAPCPGLQDLWVRKHNLQRRVTSEGSQRPGPLVFLITRAAPREACERSRPFSRDS